jgi:DNA-binding MarR family transcriptional regulator
MNFTDQFLGICQNAQDQGMHTLSHLRLLAVLTRHPEGVKMGKLAELVGLSSASMTQIVDTLEELDLAERVFNRQDRRSIWIQLTHAGEVMINDILS